MLGPEVLLLYSRERAGVVQLQWDGRYLLATVDAQLQKPLLERLRVMLLPLILLLPWRLHEMEPFAPATTLMAEQRAVAAAKPIWARVKVGAVSLVLISVSYMDLPSAISASPAVTCERAT